MAFDKDAIIASLKDATILDLADLVSAIEEEFNVSAAAPVAAAGGAEVQYCSLYRPGTFFLYGIVCIYLFPSDHIAIQCGAIPLYVGCDLRGTI